MNRFFPTKVNLSPANNLTYAIELKWQYDRENLSRSVDEDYEKEWEWVEKPV